MKAVSRVALSALLWTALAAMGAESTYDFTVCTHSRYTPLEANADIVTFGVENWGVVASSATKFWEQASTHCVGYIRVMAGKTVGKGTCRWTEATGGTAVGEWEYPPNGEPTWTWLSGTGSLKGITGGGSFRDLFSAKASEPGTGQGCRRDTGNYQLP
jgi:hypothetical protein